MRKMTTRKYRRIMTELGEAFLTPVNQRTEKQYWNTTTGICKGIVTSARKKGLFLTTKPVDRDPMTQGIYYPFFLPPRVGDYPRTSREVHKADQLRGLHCLMLAALTLEEYKKMGQ